MAIDVSVFRIVSGEKERPSLYACELLSRGNAQTAAGSDFEGTFVMI